MIKSMKKTSFVMMMLVMALALAVPSVFASTGVGYVVRNATDTANSYANVYKVGDAVVASNGTTTTVTFSGSSYIQYLQVEDPATGTYSYAAANYTGGNVEFTFEVADFAPNQLAKIHVIVPASPGNPGYNTVHTIQFDWSV